jgi:uncharacterized protein YjbI with pentapeptide repeats
MAEGKRIHTAEQEKEPAGEPPPLRSRLWSWTGFGEKKLWDWLQLLSVLAIPVVFALAGFLFTAQQEQSGREIEEQRAQDAALQAYLDQMSQLILGGDLRSSEEGSEEVRTLARARTRTVLTRLDDRRKGSVVQFLYEASLLEKERPVVSLSQVRLRSADLSQLDLSGVNLGDADLSYADLSDTDLNEADLSETDLIYTELSFASMSGANLSGANLSYADLSNATLIAANLGGATMNGANLSGAILRSADLREAYLIETDLSEADLSEADLSGANLLNARGVTEEQLEEQAKTLEGATMPDGSIHD